MIITVTIDVVLILLMGIANVASVCLELILMEVTTINCTIVTFTILFYTRQIMICEPIDIILCYLILSTLLLELVILNLNVKNGHMKFWGILW